MPPLIFTPRDKPELFKHYRYTEHGHSNFSIRASYCVLWVYVHLILRSHLLYQAIQSLYLHVDSSHELLLTLHLTKYSAFSNCAPSPQSLISSSPLIFHLCSSLCHFPCCMWHTVDLILHVLHRQQATVSFIMTSGFAERHLWSPAIEAKSKI